MTPERPPSVKDTRSVTDWGHKTTMASMAALMRLETATPARTTVPRLVPARRETRYTRKVARSAPAKAMACLSTGCPGNQSAATSQSRPAPELTPITPGDARSLSSEA